MKHAPETLNIGSKVFIRETNGSYTAAAWVRLPKSKSQPIQALDGSAKAENRVLAKPRVCITRKGAKLLDRDNLFGCVKPLLDGLCKAGLLPGDRDDQIRLEVFQEKVARKNICTLIEIIP